MSFKKIVLARLQEINEKLEMINAKLPHERLPYLRNHLSFQWRCLMDVKKINEAFLERM